MSIEGCPSHITDFVFEGCPKGSPGLRGSKMSLLNIRVRVQSITFWRGIFSRKSFLPQGPGQRSFDSRIARWREIMSKNSKETLRHRRWRGWESGAVGREKVARLGALPARPHPPLPFPLPWPFGGSSFHSPFLDLLPSGGKIHILGYLNYEFSSLPWPSGRSIL